MLKNYIVASMRSIFRNKIFSFIHITGLSTGLSLSLIMLLIVIHELSYDRHHENLDRIYRVYTEMTGPGLKMFGSSYPLAGEISSTIPEVEKSARSLKVRAAIINSENQNKINSGAVYSIDPELLDILTFRFAGGKSGMFSEKNSALISESIAAKYFDNAVQPENSLIVKSYGEEYVFSIAGVFEDFPETSTYQPEILLPPRVAVNEINKRLKYKEENAASGWSFVNWLETFLLVKEGSVYSGLEKKMPLHKNFADDHGAGINYRLQPYSDAHFNSAFANWNPYTVSREKVHIFLAIALLILLVACINYILLSVSQFFKKRKEIGVRKVIGAKKGEIYFRFLTESLVYSFLTIPLTILFVSFFNNYFAELLNVSISEYYYQEPWIAALAVFVTFFAGLVPGGYTALQYSRLSPDRTFRFNTQNSGEKFFGKKALLIFQIAVFSGMLFISLVVYHQTRYLKNKDHGFDISNLMFIKTGKMDNSGYNLYKESLTNSPYITGISGVSMVPPLLRGAVVRIPSNKNDGEFITADMLFIEKDFFDVMKIPVINGQFKDLADDDGIDRVILNRSAAEAFDIGDEMFINRGRTAVTGIVDDFNLFSLETPVAPAIFKIKPADKLSYIIVRYREGALPEALSFAGNSWNEIMGSENFIPYYYDEHFEMIYKNQYKFATLVSHSTILTLLIAAMGLFGLSMFMMQQKMDEIRIRKILGAKLTDIMMLVFKYFHIAMGAALVIGIFAGRYFISGWLSEFAYNIKIGPEHYFLTILTGFILIFTTISFFIIKVMLSKTPLYIKHE